jgi:hypothetical protein
MTRNRYELSLRLAREAEFPQGEVWDVLCCGDAPPGGGDRDKNFFQKILPGFRRWWP